MRLIRDVLEKEVIDRHGRTIGRVDGIVAEWRGNGPPVVRWLELGARPKARRIGVWLERWFHRVPTRIGWPAIRHVGRRIEVAVNAEDTPAWRLERWLRDKVFRRIPGGR